MTYFFSLYFFLIVPFSAQASLETRVGYGLNTFDDKYTGLELTDAKTMSADVILKLESFYGLGLGVRYETMSFDFNLNSSMVSEGEMTRLALLANYRFVDTTYYAGVLGTAGVQNTFESVSYSVTNTDYIAKNNVSLGFEAGIQLGIFTLGAEGGKLFAIVENPGSPDMSLNSVYAKVFIGLSFFKNTTIDASRSRIRR